MAGGEGRRINLGEKPLVLICGRPMIAYSIPKDTYDHELVPGAVYRNGQDKGKGVYS
jgi:adenosylcobinamide-phosphate guanylyltransferase